MDDEDDDTTEVIGQPHPRHQEPPARSPLLSASKTKTKTKKTTKQTNKHLKHVWPARLQCSAHLDPAHTFPHSGRFSLGSGFSVLLMYLIRDRRGGINDEATPVIHVTISGYCRSVN